MEGDGHVGTCGGRIALSVGGERAGGCVLDLCPVRVLNPQGLWAYGRRARCIVHTSAVPASASSPSNGVGSLLRRTEAGRSRERATSETKPRPRACAACQGGISGGAGCTGGEGRSEGSSTLPSMPRCARPLWGCGDATAFWPTGLPTTPLSSRRRCAGPGRSGQGARHAWCREPALRQQIVFGSSRHKLGPAMEPDEGILLSVHSVSPQIVKFSRERPRCRCKIQWWSRALSWSE